jgi:hypothetical protein
MGESLVASLAFMLGSYPPPKLEGEIERIEEAKT